MSDTNTPIVVNADPTLASLGTTARYVLAFLGGVLVNKGILPADTDIQALVGGLIGMASLGYGLYRTIANKKVLVTVAQSAPDTTAVVK